MFQLRRPEWVCLPERFYVIINLIAMNKTKKYIKPCIEITIVEVSNGILESTYIDIGGTGGKPFDSPEYGEYLEEE